MEAASHRCHHHLRLLHRQPPRLALSTTSVDALQADASRTSRWICSSCCAFLILGILERPSTPWNLLSFSASGIRFWRCVDWRWSTSFAYYHNLVVVDPNCAKKRRNAPVRWFCLFAAASRISSRSASADLSTSSEHEPDAVLVLGEAEEARAAGGQSSRRRPMGRLCCISMIY